MKAPRVLALALLPVLAGAQSIQSSPANPAGGSEGSDRVSSAATPPSGYAPTAAAPMLRGDTPATGNGWVTRPVLTVGESYGSYLPTGYLDGIGVFDLGPSRALVLMNHELPTNVGYEYTLANGTSLRGARVSRIELERRKNGQIRILQAGTAYETVVDRTGAVVTAPLQINETGVGADGFTRFCSSGATPAGTFGFVDDIYFTGEEARKPSHPHGGTEWALDVASRTLWALPAMGRGAWENVAPLETGAAQTVGLLMGDDNHGAPLFLYVGQKNAGGGGGFLDRNGLETGKLYAWKADNGDLTPEDFNGQGSSRTGTFVELQVQDASKAGQPGFDAQGYLDGDTLRAQADGLGCFSFSRPEDVSTNPASGTQAVLASTGSGNLYPSDNWGAVYRADVDFSDLSCDLTILHDADGMPLPDAGIRSPDNLDWTDRGILVQEDRATTPAGLFGGVTGIEASVWELDPLTLAFTRAAEVDRSAVAPPGSFDSSAGEIGAWETSGILDVTELFGTQPGEQLCLVTVQAHGINNGPIATLELIQGGQLLFLSRFTPLPMAAAPDAPFTLAVIGDQQRATENRCQEPTVCQPFLERFEQAVQWIADQAVAEHILFATQVGDIVENYDHGNAAEWAAAEAVMNRLHAGGDPNGPALVPYSVSFGNHGADDWTSAAQPAPCSNASYALIQPPGPDSSKRWRSVFGPGRYGAQPWFAGSDEGFVASDGHVGIGTNSYQTFAAAGTEFVHLSIEMGAPDWALEWAEQVILSHFGQPTFVTTHSIYGWGLVDACKQWREVGEASGGQEILDWFKRFDQVFLIVGGHTGAVQLEHFPNDFGNTITVAAVDFVTRYLPGDSNGNGIGWLKLFTLDPTADMTCTRVYSPWLDDWANNYQTGPTAGSKVYPFPADPTRPWNRASEVCFGGPFGPNRVFPPVEVYEYGRAETNSQHALPRLAWLDGAPVEGQSLRLALTAGIPKKKATLFWGATPNLGYPVFGGQIWFDPPFIRAETLKLDVEGGAVFTVDTTGLGGQTRHYQVLFRDGQHPSGSGVGLSNALRVTFGQ